MLRWSTGQMTSGSGGPTVSVMGALILSRLSTEYVIVPVSEQVDNAIGNPTGDVVQFAFTSGYGIVPSVWYTGTWDTTLVQGIWYNAKCLVGPGTGGVSLTAGTYTVWVKIASDPEVPVRQSGTLVIQ